MGFFRCSGSIALHLPWKALSHLSPFNCQECRTSSCLWEGAALQGAAATLAGVALHCATFMIPWNPLVPQDTSLRTLLRSCCKALLRTPFEDPFLEARLVVRPLRRFRAKLKDLLMGVFWGAVFALWRGCPRTAQQPIEMPTSTMASMGRFPSLMGRCPTLMGRFPDFVLRGRFTSWKSTGKQPIKKRGIKRFLKNRPIEFLANRFSWIGHLRSGQPNISGWE